MFTFNQFDALAFITGTGALTASSGKLINSAVLVAFIVLLTKLVEWRIRARKRSDENRLAAALEENNRLLREKLSAGIKSPVIIPSTADDQ